MECATCGQRYYRTTKSTKKQGKLELRKFCGRCRAHTLHKERKK